MCSRDRPQTPVIAGELLQEMGHAFSSKPLPDLDVGSSSSDQSPLLWNQVVLSSLIITRLISQNRLRRAAVTATP